MEQEADNHVPKQLKPYVWKKGVSGNPKGRPKGKTLKEFARDYLASLPDEEKVDYLASLPTEIVWKMAEGNPESNLELGGSLAVTTDLTDEQLNRIIRKRAEGKTSDSDESS